LNISSFSHKAADAIKCVKNTEMHHLVTRYLMWLCYWKSEAVEILSNTT